MSPLLEKELSNLYVEIHKRRAGLLAAQGLIAEAEALSEDINRQVGHEWLTPTAPCVTSHHDGDVYVRVLVMNCAADVRRAIGQLGLTIAAETVCDHGAATPKIHLDGFSVSLDVLARAELPEAA